MIEDKREISFTELRNEKKMLIKYIEDSLDLIKKDDWFLESNMVSTHITSIQDYLKDLEKIGLVCGYVIMNEEEFRKVDDK